MSKPSGSWESFARSLMGYKYLARRHPKSAKKRRVVKKWKRRLGEGFGPVVSSFDPKAESIFGINVADYAKWKAGPLR